MQSRLRIPLGVLLLAVAVWLVFGQVADHEFLLYDDDRYLSDNPAVQEGLSAESLRWAFTTFHEGTWQPLTWTSYLLEISAFGMRPGSMHLTNLVLHLLVGLMIWRVLSRATGRTGAAYVVALLFVLHPLQVQSVAWIAERKGLLAALLGLFAVDSWTSWVRQGSRRDYILAHLMFVFSVMAKPILLPLPVLLLLLDHWPYGRSLRWREKLPLFTLAVAGVVVAATAQASAAALRTFASSGLVPRLENAVTSWGLTLRRFVAPFDLTGFYPFREDHATGEVIGWAILVVGGTAAAWWLRRRRPAWSVGWAWWLLLQMPTVGLLQFGAQETADRFSYLPLLGLLVMIVFGVGWERWRALWAQVVMVVAVGALALVLGLRSANVLEPWRTSVSLFEHSIARAGGSAFAHHNLSLAYVRLEDIDAAKRHSDLALQYAPDDPTVQFQQADLLFALGVLEAAERHYRLGLWHVPAHAPAWAQVGVVNERLGRWQKAADAWARASRGQPDQPVFLVRQAQARHALGDVNGAVALLQQAERLALSRGEQQLATDIRNRLRGLGAGGH